MTLMTLRRSQTTFSIYG